MNLAIGVISGTSMDGIDVAWIESDGERVAKVGPGASYAYPEALAAELRRVVADAEAAAGPLEELERAVTDAHVAAVEAYLEHTGLSRSAIEVVGLHGQTVLHRPREGWTRQLCDGAHAASRLGLDVVCDFRSADLANGGEGAPLVPLYHAAIAEDLPKPVIFLNLGGVGNVTYIGRDGELLAFDTGPANALIDDFVRARRGLSHDSGGKLAAMGRVDGDMISRWLSDPYFQRPAPKSLDRNHFRELTGEVDTLSDVDGAATLAAFTVGASAAARDLLPKPPLTWLVCGGGRKNVHLMRSLEFAVGAPVEDVDAIGHDGDFVEAACFGFLALRSLRGWPLSLPKTTGTRAPTSGGAHWRRGIKKAPPEARPSE